MAEKSRLTYRYIQFSYQYYRQARQKLKTLFSALERSGVHRVVFYGATDLAEIAFLSLQETTIELVAVADDRHKGKKLLGFSVIDTLEISAVSFDKVVVTDDTQSDILFEALLTAGVPRSKVVFFE